MILNSSSELPRIGVLRTEPLLRSPNSEQAKALLEKIAAQVLPICKARSWCINLLKEMCPGNKSLLGMNINRGMKILIRVRRSKDAKEFIPYEQLLDTMLHELCHMNIGPHNSSFFKLWDELRGECEELVSRGITGNSAVLMPTFSGTGFRLGGDIQKSRAKPVRDLARVAAEKRARTLRLNSGGQKLGGTASSLSLKERVRRAALSRSIQETGCVTVSSGLTQLEEDQEVVKQTGKRKKSWICTLCTLINDGTNNTCLACGSIQSSTNSWQCKYCTYMNPVGESKCMMCTQPDIIVIE